MSIRKKRIIKWGIAALCLLLLPFWLWTENNLITTQTVRVELPCGELTVVHLSDLHTKTFGKDNEPLLSAVRDARPDVIVFTGDLVDAHRNSNVEPVMALLRTLCELAPTYVISGNHEYNSGRYTELMARYSEAGATVLVNSFDTLEIRGQQIHIMGMDEGQPLDPDILAAFEALDGTRLLLSHYPENYTINPKYNYAALDVDLILSGHAHGGQWILPLIGGVFAPGQGFNPKYYSGLYTEENAPGLLVSRGLGNSVFPLRLFNRPHVVVLKSGAEEQ